MKVGSLVEYIGGQCELGKTIFRLEKNTPYTISEIGLELPKSDCIWLRLHEAGQISFIISMFCEIQPPMQIDIQSIIQQPIKCV